jgi:hypothetical protein
MQSCTSVITPRFDVLEPPRTTKNDPSTSKVETAQQSWVCPLIAGTKCSSATNRRAVASSCTRCALAAPQSEGPLQVTSARSSPSIAKHGCRCFGTRYVCSNPATIHNAPRQPATIACSPYATAFCATAQRPLFLFRSCPVSLIDPWIAWICPRFTSPPA